MNEIKVITELCAEDRARLDKLLEALAGIPAAINLAGTPLPVTVEPVEHKDFVEIPEEPEAKDTDQLPWDVRHLTEEAADEGPAPVEEITAPQHTKAELQQKIATLVSIGKKEEAREIVHKYAPRVSEIPGDKVDEVWGLLNKLEG